MAENAMEQPVHVADRAGREACPIRLRLLQLAVELSEIDCLKLLNAAPAKMRPDMVRSQLAVAFERLRRDLRCSPTFPSVKELCKGGL
jgi:hypothetical protein